MIECQAHIVIQRRHRIEHKPLIVPGSSGMAESAQGVCHGHGSCALTHRAETFNQVAALYDRARPPYPQALLDDLIALTGIQAGDHILEIGSGTGHFTIPLADLGMRITAVEPGQNLAAITRAKLAEHPDAVVVECTFEDYELPPEPFDHVVSATAFHWVDPQIRVVKSGAALKPGGYLAIIQTYWGVGAQRDVFEVRSQRCYDRWRRGDEPRYVPPVIAELPDTRPDLAEAEAFTVAAHRLYEQVNHYTTSSYLDLVRTFATIQELDSATREGLLACLGQLIDEEFGGELERSDTRELWLAKFSGAAG